MKTIHQFHPINDTLAMTSMAFGSFVSYNMNLFDLLELGLKGWLLMTGVTFNFEMGILTKK